jgi:hypothetical protein
MKMFGIESSKPLEELETNFTSTSIDEDNTLLESKEVVKPEIDGRTINCKVMVEVIDWHNQVSSSSYPEGLFGLNLYLVPTPDQFSADRLASIACTGGIEPSDVNLEDVQRDGSTVSLGYTTIDHVKGYDDPKLTDSLKFIGTNVIPCISGLIGFYLDKPINGCGTTGWDFLKEVLG